MIKDQQIFDLFWESSSLDNQKLHRFHKAIEENDSREAGLLFDYPGIAHPLEMPDDALQQLFRKRRSGRRFAEKPLTEGQLGRLFAAFAEKPGGFRTLPSAGAKFPIHTYAFLLSAEGKYRQKLVYYRPDTHGLIIVGDAPSWNVLERVCCALPEEGIPSAVVVFAGYLQQSAEKYGLRAGRFLLEEVGHYAQNLALRLAYDDLAGFECGGVLDREMKALLGLKSPDMYILLAMVCGTPAL